MATIQATIAGLQNDVQYGVRAFIRSPNGWQTAPDANGFCTPRAGIPAGSLAVGTRIRTNLGNFLIVQQGRPSSLYDASCDGTWLLMENIFENREWHSSNMNAYANSSIQSYLNSTFLSGFDANIRNAIKQVKIPYRPGNGIDKVNSGANGLPCKIFLLSGYEVGYTNSNNPYFPPDGAKLAYFEAGTETSANNKRIAYLNGSAGQWWLRSPHTFNSSVAWSVYSSGNYKDGVCTYPYGVRPALVLPSDCPLSPTPNADGSYNLL